MAIEEPDTSQQEDSKSKARFARPFKSKGTKVAKTVQEATRKSLFARVGFGLRNAQYAEIAKGYGQRAFSPAFLEGKGRIRYNDITRASQWTAAILLPLVIIISLPFIVVFVSLLADVLLQSDQSGQNGILGFIVTAIGLGSFCLAAWFWFLWVRTGGFGLYGY